MYTVYLSSYIYLVHRTFLSSLFFDKAIDKGFDKGFALGFVIGFDKGFG